MQNATTLAGRHGLGDGTLEGELLLLQVISGALAELELCHGLAHGVLDLLLLSTLKFECQGGIRNDVLDPGDVRLELLLRLVLLGELLVVGLVFLGLCLLLSAK